MSKISKSPQRNTFQKEGYIKRCEKEGKKPNESYLDLFKTMKQQDEENLVDPEWQKDNLEYDLRSTKWICDKVKASDSYAQNLYAAMCNMQFQQQQVWPVLKDQRWSCSWRHAGGIVADMQEKGDYIDWYCSGIGNQENGYGLDGYTPTPDPDGKTYVPEGVVTDEIRADLLKLGWVAIEWNDEKT
jgi:hypothetical protein